MSATTTFAEVDRSTMSELEYLDDSGNVEDLSTTHGLRLAPRPETDDDTVVAHNPVTFNARDVESDEYTAFPRDVYELDGDGNPDEDLPVAWTDPTYWTTSGATVVDDDELLVSASTGGSATFSFSEWELVEDERRHYLTLVLDVVSLGSGAVVTFRAADSSGTNPPAEVRIDDAGDPSADDVVATSVGDGVIYQVPLGDVEPGVGEVDEFTVDISGSAEVRLHGVNLDRTSELVVGTSEYVETDDDGNESVATETITRSTGGDISITSLSTLGSPLGDAILRDVTIDVEQRGRDLPDELTASGREDTPSGYSREDRYTLAYRHELPAAYDLDHNVTDVSLRGALPSDRYFAAGYSTPAGGDDVSTVSEFQDLTLTSVVGSLDPAAEDPETTLVSSVIASDGIDVVVDVMLDPAETDELTSGGMSGGGIPLASSGSGGDGLLSPIRSAILVIASVVGGWVAYARGAI